MFRKIRGRTLACALLLVCSTVAGCKSGGGGLLSRKQEGNSGHAGPALGSPAALFGKNKGAAEHAEPAAFQAEEPIALRLNRSKPQSTCPVDGRAFGANDSPVTVTIQGEPFLVCSEACAKKARKEPQKYLSRLMREMSSE